MCEEVEGVIYITSEYRKRTVLDPSFSLQRCEKPDNGQRTQQNLPIPSEKDRETPATPVQDRT